VPQGGCVSLAVTQLCTCRVLLNHCECQVAADSSGRPGSTRESVRSTRSKFQLLLEDAPPAQPRSFPVFHRSGPWMREPSSLGRTHRGEAGQRCRRASSLSQALGGVPSSLMSTELFPSFLS